MFLLVQTLFLLQKLKDVEWQDIALQLRTYITDFLNSIEIINHTESITTNIKENSESVKEVKTEEEKKNLRDQKKKLLIC